jgi:hypothetical protein
MIVSITIGLSTLAIIACGLVLYRGISNQLGEIHELVNSTLTKAQTDLELAKKRIEVLEAHIVHDSKAIPDGA